MSTHNICFYAEAILLSTHNICYDAEAILMSTHNICFYEGLMKIIIKYPPYLLHWVFLFSVC